MATFTLEQLKQKQGASEGKEVFSLSELQQKQDLASKMKANRITNQQTRETRGGSTGILGVGVGIVKGLAEIPVTAAKVGGFVGRTLLRPFGIKPRETFLERPEVSEALKAKTPAEKVGKVVEFAGELVTGTGLVRKGIKVLQDKKAAVAREFEEVISGISRTDLPTIRPDTLPAPKTKGEVLERAVLGGIRKDIVPPQVKKEIKAGIRPDIKKRITGKAPELSRFFKQSVARNLDDTEISPLALAGKDVQHAFRLLEDEINSTGSAIGQFRKKISTIKVPVESFKVEGKKEAKGIDSVIKNLDNSLKKKGVLIDKERTLVKAGGRETIFSVREISEIQNIRDMLIRLKGDPTVLRVIDNRNIIDKNVNFAKEAREISNVVDPLAKSVRSDLAELNRNAIGKLEAKNLEEFSSMIELLDEFKILTSKGRNTEFILKRLLSERDRAPRQVIEKIKEITGVDLMDSAQFSRLATEILGNEQQKGLFRQEIANAGLDISELLTQAKIPTALKFLTDIGKKGKEEVQLRRGIDPKMQESIELAKIFLEAAK